MSVSRRDLLKMMGAAGGLTVFGAGYASTLKGIAQGWWGGERLPDPVAGGAPQPEFRIDRATGAVVPNPDQYVANTTCVGCTSLCGVRVRVDRAAGRVIRVSGNPYHLLSTGPFISYDTPVVDSLRLVSAQDESGLVHRSTACGRGNAVLDKLYDPFRVLTPLKRSGPRGSGKWQPISFEQLAAEVVEGGNLFGEGQVDGLRAIYDTETPIDPEAPELGPKSNQLAFQAGYPEGRIELAQRFVIQSFGSLNFTGHRGNCGLTMRAGYAVLLNDLAGQPHLKPDFENAEYILNIGTAPGNAGNPFKRQAKLVAEGRASGRLVNVFVDPVLTNADNQAAGNNSRWVPIRPGTDAALLMGMMRWILENKRFNAAFLSQPNQEAAAAAGEPSWSNAAHLVITSPGVKGSRKFLRGSQLGLAEEGENDTFAAVEAATGQIKPHSEIMGPAELFYTGQVEIEGQPVEVKTSLQLLLEESQKLSLEEYSEICGIPVQTITALADEFTSHGRRAAADCHGGTMHSYGFYAAYAAVMLNALVGNLNWKGGTGAGGGSFSEYKPGPRYDLVNFPGKAKPSGVRISRRGFAYEKTTEYKKRIEAGQNPYPAKAPWYPFSAAIQSEYIPSALNAYPYPIKAMFMWNTNPLYGQSGLYEQVREALADPEHIPLIVSIDPFINESSAYADYIVPDTVLYESWGAAKPWAGSLTKASSLRWPVVDPPQEKTPAGDPICMESFLIELAVRLGLPGFGDEAVPDQDGSLRPLRRPQDWHLRAAANIAFDGSPVPAAPEVELRVTNVERVLPLLEETLKPDEVLPVAYVLARGGRFENEDQAYEGEWLKRRYTQPMQIYNETLGSNRSSMNGKFFTGTPTWLPPVFADGRLVRDEYPEADWPLLAVSTKSQLFSMGSVGTPRLEAVQRESPVVLHPEDAQKYGIRSGDRVKISSPCGEAYATAAVRSGIMPGVIGIEHGFGHWGLGARTEEVGNTLWHASEQRGAGIAINRLGLRDITRPGFSTLADYVVGANARQDVPVKIEKV